MNDWAVIIVVYLTLFIAIPIIVILHELGHAFAYLILTKPDSIDIYIGSYTEPKNGIRFKAGKIIFHIKRFFPFVKGIGLCKSGKPETDYINYIIILLSGVLFTFIIAVIPAVIMFNTNAPLLLKIGCYVFLGTSILSLIYNLVPREVGKSYNINLDNDGKQIFFVFKIRKALPDFVEGRQHYVKNDFEQAIVNLRDVLKAVPGEKKVLRMLVLASLQLKQYEEAALYTGMLEKSGPLMLNDLLNKGCLQSLTYQPDEAILTYQQALKMDKNHLIALNNIGYELIEKGAHEVAKRALDKAIKLNPNFDHPYSNLGYSKILQGDLEAGRALIDKCLELNANNAGAHKAMGIYYLRMKDIYLANKNFERAMELDDRIDISIYNEEIKQIEQRVQAGNIE